MISVMGSAATRAREEQAGGIVVRAPGPRSSSDRDRAARQSRPETSWAFLVGRGEERREETGGGRKGGKEGEKVVVDVLVG